MKYLKKSFLRTDYLRGRQKIEFGLSNYNITCIISGYDKSMEALKEKIQAKRDQIDEAEDDYRQSAKEAKRGSVKEKLNCDKKKKALERLRDQLKKLELQETDRDENKTIALGTSKLNYLDPRISVAWYDTFLYLLFNT